MKFAETRVYLKFSTKEQEILGVLDAVLGKSNVKAALARVVVEVERKLGLDPTALLAWESVPLAVYEDELPKVIRSSWVFVLRANATTGAERHPGSRQRVMSYRGTGDLQVWRDGRWRSHLLVSGAEGGLGSRWASIPANVWHQAVVPGTNWAVVSFHTVHDDELIEERPDPTSAAMTRQRKYLDKRA